VGPDSVWIASPKEIAMKQVITALIAMTCLFVSAVNSAHAQSPPTASVGFQNKTELNLIMQGYTVVNGSKKYGTPLPMRRNGGRAFESNVPAGVRYYTVCDANNQARVLLRDYAVPVQARELLLDVIRTPGNRIAIVPGR
jgi:hypothetical protein